MKRLLFAMTCPREHKRLRVVTAEIRFITTSFKSADRISIFVSLSPQSVINSETDADNSQVSSTAALWIGTTHGQEKPFTP